MKDLDKTIVGIFITLSGCMWIYISIFGSNRISISGIFIGLICVCYLPRQLRYKKQKVKELKRKYNLEGEYSLEELEKIRIERDYQESFVKRLNLDELKRKNGL